jgi:type IV secretion system pilin
MKFKYRLILLATLPLFLLVSLSTTPAFAAGITAVCGSSSTGGISGASSTTFCHDQPPASCSSGGATSTNCNPVTGTDGILLKVTDLVAFIAGVAAVIMIIVGAFQLVTSGGDSGRVKSARGTIIGALIGLVIISLAETIVLFVVGKL